MSDSTQFELNTPLGPEALKFHKMEAREALGTISQFEIECFSEKTDIDLDAVLGKMVSVKIMLPGQTQRYLTGYITRFAHVGTEGRYQVYSAQANPWPWFLTRTTDCRIFQNKTVPDIVKEVFADHQAIAEYRDALTGSYRTREYCVQYRETDFDFICRLLEDEGIYFFFEYEKDKNVLVLADAYSAHSPAPGLSSIEFVDNFRAQREAADHVSEWRFERIVQPGKTRLIDYDFKRPKVKLDASASEPRSNSQSEHEIFDYPGNFEQQADGTHYARTRIDEVQTPYELATAKTNARGLGSGHTFKLTGHARRDQNREYLVTKATIFAQSEGFEAQNKIAGSQYSCEFTALQSLQDFRPPRLTEKPRVQGPQTAVVVGPEGDEIYTDKYGRVKVQFFWDRLGKENENSSCWMRVSHPWAGKNWGFISIPRIGQEVVVEFLEGDPDRPLITGSVYNGEQMPPWDLPEHKTAAGIRSRSTTGSAETFNELRFEDEKGKEHIYLHAEKDFNEVIENNHSTFVTVDRISRTGRNKMSAVEKDETLMVGVNRSQTVGENDNVAIGIDQNVSIGSNQSVTVGANQNVSVGGAQSTHIGGSETHSVSGTQSITVRSLQKTLIGAAQLEMIGGAKVTVAGAAYATMVGGISAHMAAIYKISTASLQTTATIRNTTVQGIDKLKAGVRKETIMGALSQSVGAVRKIDVTGADKLTVGAARTTQIGGADITQVKGAISLSAGAAVSIEAKGIVSISASGITTVTASAVIINAPVITLTGNVVVQGTLSVAGALLATSIASPIYTPGLGNIL